MRPQERLLALLPARHAHVARYAARELESMAPWFDSDRVVEALRTLAESAEPAISGQGALALHRFYPAHLDWQYRQPSLDAAALRRVSAAAEGAATPPGSESSEPACPGNLEALARSTTHMLGPLVESLGRRFPGFHSQAQQQVLRVLARVPHGRASELDFRVAATTSDRPMALLAAAVHARPRQAADLVRCVQRLEGTGAHAAAVMFLGEARFQASYDYLARLAREGALDSLPSVAVALEGLSEFDVHPALAEIARRGSGWSVVQALQSLGRLRDDRGLATLREICAGQDHPAILGTAARAAGSIGGERARRWLVELAGRPGLRPTVIVQALEALQTVGANPESLSRAAAPYLESDDPDAAASAVIASLAGDEPAAVRALKRLVLSEEPGRRAAGAHCLGHHQGEASLRVLSRLAVRDPDETVRRQALLGLGWYEPTPLVREQLLELLTSVEAELTPRAAQLLARKEFAAEAPVAEALIGAAERARGTPQARPLLAVLGRLPHRSATAYVTDQFWVRTEAEELLGLLDALDVRDAPVPSAVTDLAGRGTARVRAAVARLLWNRGETSALRLLEALLDNSTLPETLEPTLEAIEALAVASVKLCGLPRFGSLRARAAENLKSAGYQAFAASDLSLDLPKEVLREAYDPDGAVLDRSKWHDKDVGGLLAAAAGSGERKPAAARAGRVPRAAFPTDGLDDAAPSRKTPRWPAAALLALLALAGLLAWLGR